MQYTRTPPTHMATLTHPMPAAFSLKANKMVVG